MCKTVLYYTPLEILQILGDQGYKTVAEKPASWTVTLVASFAIYSGKAVEMVSRNKYKRNTISSIYYVLCISLFTILIKMP